jgi:N-acetyl-alpha-D-glucosaminyl L-malate synthase BshA
VLDVFRKIRSQIRAKLVMVGDGPDRGTLERRVEELGLTKAVDFVGEQVDLVPWLSAADLFLLPSSQESFGMAALEAMACEVAVVATRVGGLPEIIDHGVTGFLCDADDVDGMAAHSIRLRRDPKERLAIGRAAAADVHVRFCTDAIVPQYEAYYEEVLKTKDEL